MASNYTTNYRLCQWEASDKVLRTEFNADNAKIDAAIKAVDDRLTTVAAGKVSTSELAALKNTVTSQGTALSLRNCRFVTGSYTGTGEYGVSAPNSLTFQQKPVFLCVTGGSTALVLHLVRGQTAQNVSTGSTAGTLSVSWGDRSVSWYVQEPIGTRVAADCQMNANTTYHYFALLEL